MGDSLFNILEAESGIIITSNGPVIVLYPTISESSPEQDSGNILKYVKENERHKTINMKRRKKKNCRYTCLKFTGSRLWNAFPP